MDLNFKKRFVVKERTVASRLSSEEYWAVKKLAAKNNVSTAEYIRGIIIDALVEEGYDARRFRQEGNSPGREGSEATGTARC